MASDSNRGTDVEVVQSNFAVCSSFHVRQRLTSTEVLQISPKRFAIPLTAGQTFRGYAYMIRKEIPAPVVPVLEHDKDTSNYEKYVEKDDPEPAMAPGTSDEWADVF